MLYNNNNHNTTNREVKLLTLSNKGDFNEYRLKHKISLRTHEQLSDIDINRYFNIAINKLVQRLNECNFIFIDGVNSDLFRLSSDDMFLIESGVLQLAKRIFSGHLELNPITIEATFLSFEEMVISYIEYAIKCGRNPDFRAYFGLDNLNDISN